MDTPGTYEGLAVVRWQVLVRQYSFLFVRWFHFVGYCSWCWDAHWVVSCDVRQGFGYGNRFANGIPLSSGKMDGRSGAVA